MEISVGQIKVTDKPTNEYSENNTRPRYILEQMVTVQSEDVGKISKRERRRRRPGAGWDCGGGHRGAERDQVQM
jgi:hypothetical protein